MAVKQERHMGTTEVERIWTLDVTADEGEGGGEFVWNPDTPDRLPGPDDVALLLSNLDHRTATVIMAAKSVQAASALLCALLEAADIHLCKREELDAAVRALVAEKLRSRLSKVLGGSVLVSVVDENAELVLCFKSAHFGHDVLEGGCAEVIDMDKLRQNLEELLMWNDTPMLDPLLPPEWREAGGFGDSSTSGYDSRGSWSMCRHRQQRDLKPQLSSTTGPSNVWLLSIFREPTDVELVDDLQEKDRINGTREITSRLQPSSSTAVGSEHVTLSLGIVDSESADNTIVASLMLAALAQLVAAAFGATTFGSLALQAVEVRGSRGCAVVLTRQAQCSIM